MLEEPKRLLEGLVRRRGRLRARLLEAEKAAGAGQARAELAEQLLTEERERATSQQAGPKEGGPRGRLRQPGEIVATLTIGGFAVYGLVRIAYDRFYNSLGLSAEEVGIDYVSMLSRAAIGTSLGLIVVGIVLLWSYVTGATSIRLKSGTDWISTTASGLRVNISIVGSSLIAAYLTSVATGRRPPLLAPLGAGIAAVLLVVLLVFRAARAVPLQEYSDRSKERQSRREGTLRVAQNVYAVASIIAAIILTLQLPFWMGGQSAQYVRTGEPLWTNSGVVRLLFDVQIRPVDVVWTQDSIYDPLLPSGTYIYFGHSGEIAVLYHRQTDRIYRVPSQAVIMRSK